MLAAQEKSPQTSLAELADFVEVLADVLDRYLDAARVLAPGLAGLKSNAARP